MSITLAEAGQAISEAKDSFDAAPSLSTFVAFVDTAGEMLAQLQAAGYSEMEVAGLARALEEAQTARRKAEAFVALQATTDQLVRETLAEGPIA